MIALRDFLGKYQSPKNCETNITSLDGKWGGRWLIPNSEYEEFLKLYSSAVIRDNLKLVEKKRNLDELFHMFADIDISKEDLKQYFPTSLPKGLLGRIVKCYRDSITEIFENAQNISEPVISSRLTQKGKFHLHWPNLVVDNNRGRLVRERVLSALTTLEYSGNWTKWLDSASYTCTGLRMLGSLKPYERKDHRYFIIGSFDDDNNPIDIRMKLSVEDIKKTSIRVFSDETLQPLSERGEEYLVKFAENFIKPVIYKKELTLINPGIGQAKLHEVEQKYRIPSRIEQACVEAGFERQWLPENYPAELLPSFALGTIIAIGDHYSMTNKAKISCPIKGSPHKRDYGCHYHVMGPEGTYIKCHDELCKGKRFPDRPIPLPADIKQILYTNLNINNGTINNHTVITKTSNELRSISESLTELDFLADIDMIDILQDNKKNSILLTALNGGEASMAKLLQLICCDRLYFGNSWWHWDSKRWLRDPNKVAINNILYHDLGNLLKQTRSKYKDLSLIKGLDEKTKAKLHKIDSIKKKLETRDYKRRIIEEAEWIFPTNSSIKDLENILDINPYLIGFPNGVFDLNAMSFRNSVPQDYISILLDYEYSRECNPDVMLALQTFIEDIMPDVDDRHYLLKLLASGLFGKNPNELFHIFTGAGRNGKSKLSELLKLTLGDYLASISSSFLTAKITGPDQASPHLIQLRVKRLVIGSEPDHNSKLNATMIKSLSGNDEVVGRRLYQDIQSFRPFFKMILLCNNIPEIDTIDKAVWLRCRCLAFPTQFVDNPIEKHERKKDEYLSSKLPTWRLAFFHLLLKYFTIYMQEGLSMTPNMLARTGEYHVESDIYLQWLNERTESSDSSIHTCVLYDDFRTWYNSTFPGKPIPSQIIFARGIKVHKTIKKNVWDGNQNRQGIDGIKLLPKSKIADKAPEFPILLREERNLTIYALPLIYNKWYIGKTYNIDERELQHVKGSGASWTKLYPPIAKVIILKENASALDENYFFKQYILKYGLNNVRGDVYCQIELSSEDTKFIQKELDGSTDKCFKCHEKGHFINECCKE